MKVPQLGRFQDKCQQADPIQFIQRLIKLDILNNLKLNNTYKLY